MKPLLALAAALAIAGPALAQTQTTDPASPPSGTATPQADPVGGYQPDHPALSATPQPGQQIIFQAAPPPSVAYPPPPAMDHYPICKKGQYDNCRQRGG